MENLLTRAYVRQHCHECGHSYTVTLYAVLQEQRIQQQWHNLQDRDISDPDTRHILDSIPKDALEDLEDAWRRVVEASLAAGIELNVSPLGPEQEPHHH
jgi:hypothetical protein